MANQSNSKPVENGNAKHVNETNSAIHPLVMLRFNSIADHYTEEPLHVNLKRTEEDEYHSFEQIFRYRKWSPHKTDAWLIYSENRQWVYDEPVDEEEEPIGGLVIRHVEWDRRVDKEKLKKLGREGSKGLLGTWPTMTLNTTYLFAEESTALASKLSEFDHLLKFGIVIHDRKSSDVRPTWEDLEIMRWYDWGQVKATWNFEKINAEIEDSLNQLVPEIEKLSMGTLNKIFSLDLDYSCSPDIWKAVVEGNRK